MCRQQLNAYSTPAGITLQHFSRGQLTEVQCHFDHEGGIPEAFVLTPSALFLRNRGFSGWVRREWLGARSTERWIFSTSPSLWPVPAASLCPVPGSTSHRLLRHLVPLSSEMCQRAAWPCSCARASVPWRGRGGRRELGATGWILPPAQAGDGPTASLLFGRWGGPGPLMLEVLVWLSSKGSLVRTFQDTHGARALRCWGGSDGQRQGFCLQGPRCRGRLENEGTGSGVGGDWGQCPAVNATCFMRNSVDKDLKRTEPHNGKSTQNARTPGRAKGYQIF